MYSSERKSCYLWDMEFLVQSPYLAISIALCFLCTFGNTQIMKLHSGDISAPRTQSFIFNLQTLWMIYSLFHTMEEVVTLEILSSCFTLCFYLIAKFSKISWIKVNALLRKISQSPKLLTRWLLSNQLLSVLLHDWCFQW